MGKVILFTPVGGTDPISATNYYEGAILHICRHYMPDKVVLYMSKEMLDYQDEDDRYRYCLDKLSELQKHPMEYEIIERRNLTKVHEFDYFYDDFRAIIRKIYASMGEDDRLLLNISSGTPAMKSGLAVLQTLAEFPATLIQVANPEGKIGEHKHDGYDVETLWELNQDNLPDSPNRCKKVTCPSLEKIKKEEIIKKHISNYDYRAALAVADTMSENDTREYRDLILLASRRVLLDLAGVDKIVKADGFDCIPIKTSSERMLFEYALNMEIKLRREEYADFIRSITPILVDLFELVLKSQCGIDINKYCDNKKKGKTYVRQWSAEKLKGTDILQTLEQAFHGTFKGKEVYSVHLMYLIDATSVDVAVKDKVRYLREIEERVRNDAAHDIISVTDKTIEQKTGFKPAKIMQMIRELFNYTGMRVKKEYWDSYDYMNQSIVDRMA